MHVNVPPSFLRPLPFRIGLAALLGLALPSWALAQQADADRGLPSPAMRHEAVQFRHLSLEEGLSQSSVFDVLEDRRGFVWFATQDGLNRYDGREFKVYKRIPFDSTTFSSNWIFSIAEGPDGTIWAGTRGGINRLDPLTGAVRRYMVDADRPNGLQDNLILTVEVDTDGMVWAGSQSGAGRLDPTSETMTWFAADPEDPSTLGHNVVVAVFEDSEGTIWMGTANGLSRLNEEEGTFRTFLASDEPPAPLVRIGPRAVGDIEEDRGDADVLWLSGGFGLARFRKSTGAYTFYAPPGDVPQLIKLAVDPNLPHVLWATSDGGGLLRFDTRSEQFTAFRHDPRDPTSIGSDGLFAVEADRAGMMWAGAQAQSGVDTFDPAPGGFTNYRHMAGATNSLSDGLVWGVYAPPSRPYEIWSVHAVDPSRSSDRLNRIDTRTGEVEQFVHEPGDRSSLGQGQVSGILEGAEGRLWMATTGGGLNLFERASGSFRRYVHDASSPTSISSNIISGLLESPDGSLWIGTFDGGLNRMRPGRPGVFERMRQQDGDAASLLGTTILPGAMGVDAQGTVWVGTDAGLNRIDPDSGSILRIKADPDDPEALASPAVAALYPDRTGAVWVLTTRETDQVLHRLDPATGKAVRYEHDPKNPNSLSDGQLTAAYERPEEPGVLWIGTPGGGLTRIDPASDSLVHYSEAEGLPNNYVYGILGDDTGDLWLSTNNGLSRFNPETETFRNFDGGDGLVSREFNSNAYFRSADGQMIFGSVEGVTVFDPAALQPNEIPPSVVLTDFRLFNRSVVPGQGSVLARPLSQTSDIRLAHWQKTLTFEFVALHFKSPEKNTYAYMLEGFDDDWIAAGTQRSATYTNLDPGTYTFRVKAANSDGVWNQEGTSMALVIAPPFWQTAWFRILAVVGLLGLGFTTYRARVHHMTERNRVLESQVAVRTVELRSKNAQLEQSHAIVRAINAEMGFEALLSEIFEQTRVMPGVEKASALVFDTAEEAFVFRAGMGWDVKQLAGIRMTEEEAAARYSEHAEEVANDVFLERDVAARPGPAALSELPTPASMLVMRIRTGTHVDGYLIFDNMHDRDAFDQQDLDLLVTLREHVRSAFAKTRLLEDLRRSLEHLKTTQSQLVQAEKMASLGQMTAGIAHEIKNPLNFVNNFASLCAELAEELEEELADRGVGDDELRQIIADLRLNSTKIQEHGKRADGIVKSMLQHSRGKAGEMQSTDLNALLDEYVNLAYHGMRAQKADFNVTIDRRFDPEVGAVRVIPQELGRVFINLLNNAFYAVHEQAQRTNGRYVPRLSVETVRSNGAVRLVIADNGPGIPEGVRARIFEPFFTTKPTGEGTGLGLSMSYDIITQVHRGEIDVESREGEGTTFTITMPAA